MVSAKRSLTLVRHGAAMNEAPGRRSDFERELSPRGIEEAKWAGKILAARSDSLGRVVSSTAIRVGSVPTQTRFRTHSSSAATAIRHSKRPEMKIDTKERSKVVLGNGTFQKLFHEQSYGKMSIEIEHVHGWRRLSKSAKQSPSAKVFLWPMELRSNSNCNSLANAHVDL